MSLTPERIAAFERTWDHDPEALEIGRLARLGLKVEAAPTVRMEQRPPYRAHGPSALPYIPLPNEWGGKRVALVVLEDSE